MTKFESGDKILGTRTGSPTNIEVEYEVARPQISSFAVAGINSLEAVDTTLLSTGDKVELLGYYEQGDGGDGVFYWDLSSAATINNPSGYTQNLPIFITVLPTPIALNANDILTFNNGATFTLTTSTVAGVTQLQGYLDKKGVVDGEKTSTLPQITINSPGGYEPFSITVEKIPTALLAGSQLDFPGGGIFVLTANADKEATNLIGNLTGSDVTDNEEAFFGDNSGTIIEPTYSGFNGTGRWKRVLDGSSINVRWFGAKGDGSTDDTTAISDASTLADTLGKKVFYPKGSYSVGNFHRKVGVLHFGDHAYWLVSILSNSVSVPIPLEDDVTWEDFTVYVNPTGSDTTNYGLTPDYPYRTIQYAYDSIPKFLKNQVTINLSSGTHIENYLKGTTDKVNYPRKAVLYGRGKVTTSRTQRVNNDLVGNIVLEGQGETTVIATSPASQGDCDYGVYNTQGQLGLKNLKLSMITNATTVALLVSHRGFSYVHTDDVIIDGIDTTKTSFGAYAESSGQLEMVDSEVLNCNVGVLSQTSGDNVSFSGGGTVHHCGIGVWASSNSWFAVSMTGTGMRIYECTEAVKCTSGAYMEIRGNSGGERVSIESPCSVEQGRFYFVIAKVSAEVTGIISSVYLNDVHYSEQLVLRASTLSLQNTNSYIGTPPNNNQVNPILLTEGSTMYKSGTNNIVGSGDEGATYDIPTILVDGNDAEIVTYGDYKNTYKGIRIIGGTEVRTGCYLSADGVTEGETIYVYGDSWGVELVDGVTMDLPTSITFGNASGQYTGATFMFNNSKWRLVGLGIAVP